MAKLRTASRPSGPSYRQYLQDANARLSQDPEWVRLMEAIRPNEGRNAKATYNRARGAALNYARDQGIDTSGANISMGKGLREKTWLDRNAGWLGPAILAAPFAAPLIMSALGSGTAAAGGSAATSSTAGAVTGTLPSGLMGSSAATSPLWGNAFAAPAISAGSSAAAPAIAAGGSAAGSSMLGKTLDFFNSPFGMELGKAGLHFAQGALTPDPYNRSERFAELEGEKGRLLRPENAAYNTLRETLAALLGVSRRLGSDFSMPNVVPGRLGGIDVPGIPFQLGGVGSAQSPNFTLPGLDFSVGGRDQLSGYLEQLLTPPPPPDLTPAGTAMPRGAQPSRRRSPR